MALSSEARKKQEDRYALLIAQAKERAALAKQDIPSPPLSIVDAVPSLERLDGIQTERKIGKDISFAVAPPLSSIVSLVEEKEEKKDFIPDEAQQRAIDLALEGKSFCLIGAAGTGKTTVMREILKRMIQAGKISPLRQSTKHLRAGAPGAVVLSFTNKAVANIRKGMPKEISCLTAHKLIEFEPVFYEIQNADGEWVKTMRFEPARGLLNKLPSSLSVVSFEESSTISTDLFRQLTDAMHGTEQFIFLGDIQQLPPIYGQAILGFKMLELEVVELTQVHRQLSDSPILAFAWEILKGIPLSAEDIKARFNTDRKFRLMSWANRGKCVTHEEQRKFLRLRQINAFINRFLENGEYEPMEDMILMPFNKGVGTLEINKSIADNLGKKREAEVHEIIAGFRKFYYAIGDKVLVNKQEAVVTKISRNAQYVGKEPLSSSTKLNRWGHYELDSKADLEDLHKNDMSLEEMEMLLATATASSGEIEEKKNQASHVLYYRYLTDGVPEEESEAENDLFIQTTGEFNEMLFAYVLTIHKAQGSEWKKVLLFLDSSHATMISRELLYTAVTRARESLYIFCEPEHFKKGILQQRIKGNTLAEKAEFFKGKLEKED